MTRWVLIILSTLSVSMTRDLAESPKWYDKNWGLFKNQFSINAKLAWSSLGESYEPVVVAVIDTGVDATHPVLSNHVSKYGWDFVYKRTADGDKHGHGTHVSGIISAVANERQYRALIFPVNYYAPTNSGTQNLSNLEASFVYAIDHGAKIINYSGGGPEFSEYEYKIINYANKYGVLVVAAAGNDGKNIELVENHYYPASYTQKNILTVANLNSTGQLDASSNWGKESIDIAAPGHEIYSSIPTGKFGYQTGTSQATAFVSGIAALVWSENPHLTHLQIKQILLDSAVPTLKLKGKIATAGRVDAYAALQLAKKRYPKIGVSQ